MKKARKVTYRLVSKLHNGTREVLHPPMPPGTSKRQADSARAKLVKTAKYEYVRIVEKWEN